MKKAPYLPENLWGYGKRLAFVDSSILSRFPGHARSELTVLDVGCGNGSQLAIPLAESGYRVTGVDPDTRSVEHGRALSSQIAFVNGTLSDIPVRPFHCVIVSEVLEHLSQPEHLLSQIGQYLHPHGLAIVTVPNGYGEFEIDRRAFRALHLGPLLEYASDCGRALLRRSRKQGIRSSEDESPHVQRFTLKQLRTLFSRCGLSPFRRDATSFVSGPLIAYTLGRVPGFIRFNTAVADMLPMSICSAWMFALAASSERGEASRDPACVGRASAS